MSNVNQLNPSSLFSVKNWTCLVSGGGTGIGLMIAQTLAAGGAKVYISSRRGQVLENTARIHGDSAPGQLIPLEMDITDKDSVKAAAAEFAKKEKHLHLLVNNAGIATNGKTDITKFDTAENASKAILDTDETAWTNIYKTNVFGYFWVAGAFLPYLAATAKTEHGISGSIINIASMSGMTANTQGGQFAYNSSKAAVVSLTKLMAFEFSRDPIKVRVNAISPGYFPSEMTQGESDGKNKTSMDTTDLKDFVPAKRPGRDQDMAQTALSLACNQYINGQILAVDGGWLLFDGLLQDGRSI